MKDSTLMRRESGGPPATTGGNGRQDVPELVSVSRSDRVTTLVLAGDLDLGSVPPVRTVLGEEVARRPAQMFLDVSAVEFVDSSGLHALVETYRQLAAQGGALELTRVPDHLRRLLEITELASLLTRAERDAVE